MVAWHDITAWSPSTVPKIFVTCWFYTVMADAAAVDSSPSLYDKPERCQIVY